MKVYLSYSSKDKDLASDIASRLSEEGYDVWNWQEELFPGDNWAKNLGEALEQSDAMIVLISKDSMDSWVVRKEISYAIGSQRYEGRLIPIQIGSLPRSSIPWILTKMNLIRAVKDRDEIVNRIV